MQVKHLIGVAAVALAPLAAYADQGDKYLEQQVGTPKSTLTRAEVRMQPTTPHLGQQHLVDLQTAATSHLTRADVLRELMAAAALPGGA